MFCDVRHPRTKKLLFRFDPGRMLVEIGERGDIVTIDLTRYQDDKPKQPGRTSWPPPLERKTG